MCVCVCWYCVTRFSLWYQCIDNTNVNIKTLPVQHFDNFPIVHHHSRCNFEICLAKVAVISTFKSFNLIMTIYNCRKLPHLCSLFYVLFSCDINQLKVKALKFYRDRPCCTSPLSYHFVFIVIILYYTFTVLE